MPFRGVLPDPGTPRRTFPTAPRGKSRTRAILHFGHRRSRRPADDRLRIPGDRNTRSPHTKEAGFLTRLFPRERWYAELGYLLPSSIGPAVKTRCIGSSSWLASYLYYTRSRHFRYALNGWEDHFGPAAVGRVGEPVLPAHVGVAVVLPLLFSSQFQGRQCNCRPNSAQPTAGAGEIGIVPDCRRTGSLV